MLDQPWADGYVVDIGYTHGFYRELAPSLLHFVTVLGRVNAVDPAHPFTYVELGCGNGYTTTLLAAANPQGRFLGVDFNPTHIHTAQQRADSAGVPNVTFLEKSFGELGDADVPDADIVALHGVYSWINAENRRHIIEFIRRKLKPAGIVYVSYNALPGLSQVAPLQRLLVDYAGSSAGSLDARVRDSLQFAAQMRSAGARYFLANPMATSRLDSLSRQDPRYLAHEYFNADWSPFYHADVARDLMAAKASYAGSATIIDNFEQLVLTPELHKMVTNFSDRATVEAVKDFAVNQVFRRDVFTRGAPSVGTAALERELGETRFALVRPRADCRFSATTPAGEVTMREEVYSPVLDALAGGPKTFDELQRAPELSGKDRGQVRQALFGMAALGNVLPALPFVGEENRRESTSRFNEMALAEGVAAGSNVALASPVLGSGQMLSFVDALFLHYHNVGGENAIHYVRKELARAGAKLMRNGKAIDSEDENRAVIGQQAEKFSGMVLPLLIQLGIAD